MTAINLAVDDVRAAYDKGVADEAGLLLVFLDYMSQDLVTVTLYAEQDASQIINRFGDNRNVILAKTIYLDQSLESQL